MELKIDSINVISETSPTDYISLSAIEPLSGLEISSLINSHRESNKCFILARILAKPSLQSETPQFYYYSAFLLNKILFRKYESNSNCIFRMLAPNPATNTEIIGNVEYFAIAPEDYRHLHSIANSKIEASALKRRNTLNSIPKNNIPITISLLNSDFPETNAADKQKFINGAQSTFSISSMSANYDNNDRNSGSMISIDDIRSIAATADLEDRDEQLSFTPSEFNNSILFSETTSSNRSRDFDISSLAGTVGFQESPSSQSIFSSNSDDERRTSISPENLNTKGGSISSEYSDRNVIGDSFISMDENGNDFSSTAAIIGPDESNLLLSISQDKNMGSTTSSSWSFKRSKDFLSNSVSNNDLHSENFQNENIGHRFQDITDEITNSTNIKSPKTLKKISDSTQMPIKRRNSISANKKVPPDSKKVECIESPRNLESSNNSIGSSSKSTKKKSRRHSLQKRLLDRNFIQSQETLKTISPNDFNVQNDLNLEKDVDDDTASLAGTMAPEESNLLLSMLTDSQSGTYQSIFKQDLLLSNMDNSSICGNVAPEESQNILSENSASNLTFTTQSTTESKNFRETEINSNSQLVQSEYRSPVLSRRKTDEGKGKARQLPSLPFKRIKHRSGFKVAQSSVSSLKGNPSMSSSSRILRASDIQRIGISRPQYEAFSSGSSYSYNSQASIMETNSSLAKVSYFESNRFSIAATQASFTTSSSFQQSECSSEAATVGENGSVNTIEDDYLISGLNPNTEIEGESTLDRSENKNFVGKLYSGTRFRQGHIVPRRQSGCNMILKSVGEPLLARRRTLELKFQYVENSIKPKRRISQESSNSPEFSSSQGTQTTFSTFASSSGSSGGSGNSAAATNNSSSTQVSIVTINAYYNRNSTLSVQGSTVEMDGFSNRNSTLAMQGSNAAMDGFSNRNSTLAIQGSTAEMYGSSNRNSTLAMQGSNAAMDGFSNINSTLAIQGSTAEMYGSSNRNSTLAMQGSNAAMDGFSNINSTLAIQGSTAEMDGFSNRHSTLSVQGSTVEMDGFSNRNSTLAMQGSNAAMDGFSNINSTLAIQGSTAEMYGSSNRNSTLAMQGSNAAMDGFSNINSTLAIQGSTAEMYGSSNRNSTLAMQGSNAAMDGFSNINSTLAIQGSTAEMDGFSNRHSTLSVQGSTVEMDGFSNRNSTLAMQGSNAAMDGFSNINSTLAIQGSTAEMYGSSNRNSTLAMQGSNAAMDGFSNRNSTLAIQGSTAEMDGFSNRHSTLAIQGSTAEMYGFSNRHSTLAIQGSTAEMDGFSNRHSTMAIQGSTAEMYGSSNRNSTLAMQGSNAAMYGFSNRNSTLAIQGSTAEMDGFSNRNSTLAIQGSTAEMDGFSNRSSTLAIQGSNAAMSMYDFPSRNSKIEKQDSSTQSIANEDMKESHKDHGSNLVSDIEYLEYTSVYKHRKRGSYIPPPVAINVSGKSRRKSIDGYGKKGFEAMKKISGRHSSTDASGFLSVKSSPAGKSLSKKSDRSLEISTILSIGYGDSMLLNFESSSNVYSQYFLSTILDKSFNHKSDFNNSTEVNQNAKINDHTSETPNSSDSCNKHEISNTFSKQEIVLKSDKNPKDLVQELGNLSIDKLPNYTYALFLGTDDDFLQNTTIRLLFDGNAIDPKKCELLNIPNEILKSEGIDLPNVNGLRLTE